MDSEKTGISVLEGDRAQAAIQPMPVVKTAVYKHSCVSNRIMAMILDLIFIFVVSTIVATTTGLGSVEKDAWDVSIGFDYENEGFLIFIFAILVYFTIAEKVFGRTVGKASLGLRVVDEDGKPIGWGASIWRNLLRFVDGLPYVVPYLVGWLVVWRSDRRQRVGDIVAHTLVVEHQEEAVFKPKGQ